MVQSPVKDSGPVVGMICEKIVSEGLSHNSYLVGADGAAAVIDPRRDCAVYREIAERHGMAITHIFETHRNEDYCIGSLELAEMTGATILHGAQMDFAYGTPVRDGDEFPVGPLITRVLETPGHTDESISLVLIDPAVSPDPYLVFTGDILFAGDVGRTDFFKDRRDEMAGKLYDAIWKKIVPLGDGVIVYPAHGAGSACGGRISDHPLTTIGYERRTNPVLQLDREAFIRKKTTEHHYLPPYFAMMEQYNQFGTPPLAGRQGMRPLTPAEVAEAAGEGALIVDLRGPEAFAGGHVPGSFNIWLNGLSSYLGYFASYDRPIIFVDEFNRSLRSAEAQALRIGFDMITGYLGGGMAVWNKSGRSIGRCGTCSVGEVDLHAEGQFILDVRDIRNRIAAGAIPGSRHVYAGHIERDLALIPEDRHILVYCDAGFKGSLAASVLLRNGYEQVTNMLGGMAAWKNAGLPVEKIGA